MDYSITKLSNSWCFKGLDDYLQFAKGVIFWPLDLL